MKHSSAIYTALKLIKQKIKEKELRDARIKALIKREKNSKIKFLSSTLIIYE